MCKDNKEKVCAYCGSTEKLRFNKKFKEQETEELNAYLSVRPIKILNKRKRLSKYKHITRQSSKNNLWEYKRNINGIRYRESGFETEEEAHDAYVKHMKELGVEP